MNQKPVKLGPFRVGDRIGEGGMGSVYRGEHRQTGVPVAIKVIRRDHPGEGRRRFREEVRAHAGLQHPGVVYLFEYGEIDDEAARSSEGVLGAGDPFVAMELADRGTVRDAMPLESWEAVCRVLIQILDALAYAHARGVVHRDLKPENFLVFEGGGDSTLDRRIKLADFGIAHAFERERDADTDELTTSAGTPHYMSPEQSRGHWRAYGPWTDLYGLGCIAWELVCGRPPYTGESAFDILIQHEEGHPPPLDPQFPVPDELEAWIRRAMAVDPDRRFRRAADAAWALPRGVLADETPGEAPEVEPSDDPRGVHAGGSTRGSPQQVSSTDWEAVAPTLRLDELDDRSRAEGETVQPTESAGMVDASEHGGVASESGRPSEASPPPIPEDWQPEETESLPAPLVGTGLGLFGLREPPFVNRAEAGDRIWGALQDVVEESRCRMVFVTGDAGTGKSRLAEWMATRAHEVGALRVIRAIHTRSGGPSEGLRAALEATLRTVKLERDEVFEHLRASLGPLDEYDGDWVERDARALTEFLRPTSDEADEVEGPRYRFANVDQKRALLVRLFRRLANARPILLWIDDLQWADDALGLLEQIAEASSHSRDVLVVSTVRSDLVPELPRFAERLEALQTEESSTTVRLRPLSRDDQRELIEGLLPLEEELAELLADRTEGHPLFAMQLLAHWSESGELVVGPEGFELSGEEGLELPEDIHELWLERLERLARRFPAAHREAVVEALERAAALGREVDGDEWNALCETFDGVSADRLRDGLVERGLAEETDRGWAFTHGMLVDTLERHASEAGRWRDHHRACVEVITELHGDGSTETAGRRAEHWIEAGEVERALEPLFEEAERRGKRAEFEAARQILVRREELLDDLDIPDDDPRRIDNDRTHAFVDLRVGVDPEVVCEKFEEVRRRAERVGSARMVSQAIRGIAMCRRPMGEGERARERAREAVDWAKKCDDESRVVGGLLTSGWMEYFLGDLEAAQERFGEARRRASDIGEDYLRLHATSGLAWVATSESDWERASARFEQTLSESRTLGYVSLAAKCLSGLAEIDRYRGEADEARRRYRLARDLSREIRSAYDEALMDVNLAGVELMERRFEEAESHLDAAQQQFQRLSRLEEYAHLLRVSRLAHAAGVEDWSRFDEHFEPYDGGWPEGAPVMKDQAWTLEMAGDYAAEAGKRGRAERVWRLASELWGRLGDDEARLRVDDKIER